MEISNNSLKYIYKKMNTRPVEKKNEITKNSSKKDDDIKNIIPMSPVT